MRSVLVGLVLFISACASKPNVAEVILETIEGESININLSESQLTVVYFLSPECPLCINYTLAIRQLEEEFASDSLRFVGVFSKEWYSAEEVLQYKLKYDLDFEMLFDSETHLAHVLDATVTPEVFVLDGEGKVLYSGKIDNWVNDLGKKKLEVSENYLENVLLAYREGKAIQPKHTEAIGCLIE